jgi:hypothetical protein
MGVILKYLIDFPDAGFKVSNDLLKGGFLIDVAVQVSMQPGAAGTTFELELIDLPQKKSDDLLRKVEPPKTTNVEKPKTTPVTIKLGYYDGPFKTVVHGVCTEAQVYVSGDTLVTRLKGEEVATHALNHTSFKQGLEGKVTVANLAEKVLKSAFPDAGGTGPGALDVAPDIQNVSAQLDGPALRAPSVMEVLDALAQKADAELVVTDGKVRMGRPVKYDAYKPDEYNRNVNLAVFRPFAKALAEDDGGNRIESLKAEQALGFYFTIAGDPGLRLGNTICTDVDGYRAKGGVEFRVLKVEHVFNLSQGYLCRGVAVRPSEGGNWRRMQDVLNPSTAEDVARKVSRRIKDEPRRRPAVEVGAVKSYLAGGAGAAPHRATLYFGQRFDPAETQPSVRAPVDNEAKQLFSNKPVVSLFAWHKCGLVTPVYPGMKAVVTHNLGLADDGLVTGFLWSDQPAIDPPPNQAGDWWLCLPVNFDSSKPPDDSTAAANDLIANNGHRVIEVSGLRVTVGKAKLGKVGSRPKEGNDDEFLIEHKPSGTTFTIDAKGGLTIDCKGSLKIKAKDVLIEGDVNVTGNVDIKE